MDDPLEILQIVLFLPFKNFKEKIRLTKQYDCKAKVEVVEDKYVYVESREVAN